MIPTEAQGAPIPQKSSHIKLSRGQLSFGFATSYRHDVTPLGQVTGKIRATLIYKTLDSYHLPSPHFHLFATHTLLLAERCPSTACAGFLQTGAVATAAGPFSCSWTTVQTFRCSLERYLPEDHWQTALTESQNVRG